MALAKRVVVVEDEVLIAMHIKTMCEENGAQVVGTAHDAATARETILRTRPDYVIMDLRLGGSVDGVDVAQLVLGELPEIKFIFVTGSQERMSIARIESVRPQDLFIKPVNTDQIRKALG